MKSILLVLGLSILALILVTPLALIDLKPAVAVQTRVDTSATQQSKRLLKNIIAELKSGSEPRVIQLGHRQLDSLLALASHTLPRLSAKVIKTDAAWRILATLKVPGSGSFYINTVTELPYGEIPLDATRLRIGKLPVSLQTLLEIGVNMVNLGIKDLPVIDADKLITRLELGDTGISVRVHPEFRLERFKTQLKSSGRRALQQIAHNQDHSNAINHYLKLLGDTADSLEPGEQRALLAAYIAPLFSEVRTRSTVQSAQAENRSALLALVYFAGDYLIRRVIKNSYAPDVVGAPSVRPLLLQGRHDLTLHFLYSATIEMLASAETSIGIGEIKELSDANRGGSGFSFVDLLADKAGIYFADSITDPDIADEMQRKLAAVEHERDFFPSITGLPEGLDERTFTRRFVDTESPAYRALEADIDRRIRSRRIYAQ